MRTYFAVLMLSLSLVVLAGCQDRLVQPEATLTASPAETDYARLPGADQGGRLLTATLTGAAEVPGPGDPDGSGSATVTLNQGQGIVCFELVVEGIEPATLAHIHVGTADAFGGVVVGLTAPTDGSSSGCIENVDPDLIKAIRQNPAGYYVNVHNNEYPGGALRGQLTP